MTDQHQPSRELAPLEVDGELITRGDLRQDMRDRKTDSWTSVVSDVALFAANIAPTNFVPKAMRNDPAAVTGAIMYGREIGMAPMMALQNLHIIEGKPSLAAEGQRALVLQAGHEIIIAESTSAKSTVKGRRRDSTEWSSVTWSIDDARQAGLLSKSNWKSYPRQMLVARATAELCRNAFADVIRGLMATEELEDVVATTGDAPSEPAADGQPVQRKRRTTKKAAAAPAGEAPSRPEPDVQPPTPKTGAGATEGSAAGEAVTGSNSPVAPVPPEPEAPAPPVAPAPPSGATAGNDVSPSPATSEEGGSSSEPAPSDGPDEDGAYEAEVVEEESEPMVTPGQVTKLVTVFNKLDVRDRAERLYITGVLARREVESAKHLTKAEASSVIDSLEGCSDNDELQQVVNHTAEHAAKQSGGDDQ